MDQHTVELIITIVGSVVASSGFWALVQNYINRNDASKKLLLGIAHDRIMYLSKQYLAKGYLTPDESENLITYLYEPYIQCGGNGSAQHIMEKVKHLEVRTTHVR